MLMVRKLLLLLTLCAGFALAQNRVFELRTYTCFEGKLEALKTRFRDHTIRIFKTPRHGEHRLLGSAGSEGKKTTLIYILAHASREPPTKNWKEFRDDPEWKKVAADSEANGKIVAEGRSPSSWTRPISRKLK